MPNVPSAAEKARAEAVRAQADASVALARFESLNRSRDAHRRRATLLPLGADPTTAAPAGWATHQSTQIVASASIAQPLSPDQAEAEAGRLLWVALAKILGAVLAAAIGIGIAVAMAVGMAS